MAFVPHDSALLRMPTAPVALAAATRLDVDSNGGALTEFLHGVLSDPVLRETVELSSDVLAGALNAIEEGRPVERSKVERAAHTVARYVLRMTGRPTPFGLYAGVAIAGFDADTKVRVGSAHRKGARVDAGWLGAVLTRLERRPEVLRLLRVTANDLCFERGDRLVLPYVPSDADVEVRSVTELSVRRTGPVALAIRLSRRPIGFSDLVAAVHAEFPRASVPAVEAMLGQLVARDLLLTDLHPPLVDTELLDHVLSRLSDVDSAEVAALREIREHLAAYREAPIGGGRETWGRAVTAMRALHPADKPPIQVDLRVDAEVRLPRAVAEEAARAATALCRLAPVDPAPEHLRQYREAFVERYGAHELVPLAELVDPERGLGAPAGYRVPASERTLLPSAGREHGRDDALAALAQLAMLDGGELVLDDALVDRLAFDHSTLPEPDSVELCVQVLATSAAALDAGDFRLVVSPAVGSPNAGEMFSRFAYLFDGEPVVPAPVRDERDPLPVQLTFRPLHGRMANLLQVPSVCDHTLAIGTFADRGQDAVLGMDDLVVGVDGERLYLASPRHGREVLALSPHRINLSFSAANAVRLVREIAAAGYRGLDGWWWGSAAGRLPMQPRVRYGRTVLSAATWRAGDRLRDRSLSWREWSAELDAWRARWRVPERVYAMVSDARLDLDLGVGLHRRLLRDELARRQDTVIGEVIGTDADTGWLDGHANELVVPMRSTSTHRRPAVVVERKAPPARRILPGGEWLYAKLYASRSRHRELLAEHLAPFVAASTVDRWFFIRYADPDPHLRLRFHGAPDLLPRLHDWADGLCAAGLASRLVIDSYEPELARYGGPALLETAERAFQADSEAVLAQLRLPPAGLAPEMLAAANYVDMLRAFGDADWEEWLLAHYPRSDHHRTVQALRREAVELIDPNREWNRLAERDGGPELLAAWQRRVPALAAYGEAVRRHGANRDSLLPALLHMHHNRLVGIDPTVEARSLAILRGTVESHRNRARFAK